MLDIAKKHWPLLVSIGIFWATVLVVLNLSVRQNQGHLVYVIDDIYIHMSIAKNMAEHGIWGVTRYGFSSSSSSLLWTLALAAVYRLLGANEIAPLAMNITIASALIATMYIILLKQRDSTFFRQLFICLVLISIIFVGPLPALVFSGMEHITHALLTVIFVFIAAKALLHTHITAQSRHRNSILSSAERGGALWAKGASDAGPHPLRQAQGVASIRPAGLLRVLCRTLTLRRDHVIIFVLAPLVTLIRFEGIFLVLTVSVLFALQKRFLRALAVLALGVLPVVVYGIISTGYHWYFLPNSVLLKGSLPSFNSIMDIVRLIGYAGLLRLEANPHVLWLVISSSLIWIYQYVTQKTIWSEIGIINLIFSIITIFHMQFAIAGWFYRYEAYIVILGMLVVAVSLYRIIPEIISLRFERRLILPALPGMLVIILIGYPFIVRAARSLVQTPQATTNIFQQQYQMGLFLNTFYQGQSIAVNDLGAVNYLADVRAFDLWGLGTLEVADSRLAKTYDVGQIDALTRQKEVKIAIFYDALFREYFGVPPDWVKIGEWQIANNIVCADDTVGFYAVDQSAAPALKEHFEIFSTRLPAEVGHVSAK